MNYQVAIIKAATKRGWNPSRLTGDQIKTLALEVRPPVERVKGVYRAVATRVGTIVRLNVVSDERMDEVEKICQKNECGSFNKTAQGEPICMRCGCSEKWLRSKWKSRSGVCPAPVPYWDNRTWQENA